MVFPIVNIWISNKSYVLEKANLCEVWKSVISYGTSRDVLGCFMRIFTHIIWYSSFWAVKFFSAESEFIYLG